MTPKEPLRYEDAAEQVTVTGWACKKCHCFFGEAKSSARWCCSSEMECPDCKGRNTEKHYTVCKTCRDRREDEKWFKLYEKAVDWKGEPLVGWRDDRYFFNEEDLADYIHWHAEEEGVSPLEFLEGMRLVVCKPSKPRPFNMSEYLQDELPPDFDDGDQFKEIEKVVNEFIESRVWSYFGTNIPVKVESVKEAIGL